MRTINEHNYESYLLDFVDGELTDAEQEMLLQYMRQHPELKEELQLLQKTKPEIKEPVPFPDKSSLYRSEPASGLKKAWVIPWRKIRRVAAIAACLIFGIWFFYKKEKTPPVTNTTIVKAQPVIQPPMTKNKPLNKKVRPTPADTVKNQSTLLASRATRQPEHAPIAGKVQEQEDKAEVLSNAKKLHPIQEIQVQPLSSEKSFLANAEPGKINLPEKQLQTTSTTGKEIVLKHTQSPKVITGSLQQLKEHKKTFDSTFTDKLFALQNKMSHPFKALHIKEVKIGNLSLVFN